MDLIPIGCVFSDFALQSAIQGKDFFKDLAIKEYLKMPFTDFDYENTKNTLKVNLKNQETGWRIFIFIF